MREQLKNARKSKGLTQQGMADELGISLRMYQRLETGASLGKITHWDMLEDLFDIPQRQLRVAGASDKIID